jgi:hypothetical protein
MNVITIISSLGSHRTTDSPRAGSANFSDLLEAEMSIFPGRTVDHPIGSAYLDTDALHESILQLSGFIVRRSLRFGAFSFAFGALFKPFPACQRFGRVPPDRPPGGFACNSTSMA